MSDAPRRDADASVPYLAGRVPVAHEKPGGLRRIILAFGASFRGLAGAYRKGPAFGQELALAVVVIPLGLWLGRTGVERALLVGAVLNILVVELVNSAIETTVDRIGLERHPLSGQAKDIGSAAVFTSFVLAGAVWLLVLLGR